MKLHQHNYMLRNIHCHKAPNARIFIIENFMCHLCLLYSSIQPYCSLLICPYRSIGCFYNHHHHRQVCHSKLVFHVFCLQYRDLPHCAQDCWPGLLQFVCPCWCLCGNIWWTTGMYSLLQLKYSSLGSRVGKVLLLISLRKWHHISVVFVLCV